MTCKFSDLEHLFGYQLYSDTADDGKNGMIRSNNREIEANIRKEINDLIEIGTICRFTLIPIHSRTYTLFCFRCTKMYMQ